jgi:hypothetical protein
VASLGALRLLALAATVLAAAGLALQAVLFVGQARDELRAPPPTPPLRSFAARLEPLLPASQPLGLLVLRRPPGAVNRVPRTLRYVLYPRRVVQLSRAPQERLHAALRRRRLHYLVVVGAEPSWLQGPRGAWWRLLASGRARARYPVRVYRIEP